MRNVTAPASPPTTSTTPSRTQRLARLCRHLWVSRRVVRRAFPPAALAGIEAAIAASERSHAGQIRFAVEDALEPGAVWRGQSPRERALEVFAQARVWDTEANNGVLIYLLLADHAVEIVVDRGLHQRTATTPTWEALCQAMQADFAQGAYATGVQRGIDAVTQLLQQHFPPRPAAAHDGDPNELPDAPVVL